MTATATETKTMYVYAVCQMQENLVDKAALTTTTATKEPSLQSQTRNFSGF